MDPIRDFAADVGWVLDACLTRVAAYPPALAAAGLAYLQQHRLLPDNNQGNGIVYLLPFWLGAGLGLDRDICRRVALASTFGLLYFFAQDDVIDSEPGQYRGDLLPLANLFLLNSLAPYRELFAGDSAFWRHLEAYFAEWAASVTWERQEHWCRPAPFARTELPRLAGKAAPLKVPCAAVAILTGRDADIAALAATIDHVQVVFQLIDDLRDWRTDLAAGNYTYFLTRVLAGLPETAAAAGAASIETAPGLEEVLAEVLSLATHYNQLALASSASLPLPYLKAYIASQDRQCRRLCEEFLSK